MRGPAHGRRRLAGVALLALLAAGAAPVDPRAPSVTVRADRGKVQLGEPFHVVITAVHAPDVSVSLPAALPLGEAFAEIGRVEADRTLPGGLVRRTFDLTLLAFQPGKLALAQLPVTYVVAGQAGQVLTDTVDVEVSSVVGDGKEELKPIAPPVAVIQRDLTLLWAAAGALAALALLVLGWALARRRRRRRKVERSRAAAADRRAPHEIALARIAELERSPLLAAEDRRPLYFALSEVVREYLGQRHGFDALELTTGELLERLERTTGGLPVVADARAWLESGDLVKYAGLAASRDDALAALAGARELVERSRPASTPAPAPAPPVPPAPPEPPPAGTAAEGARG